MIYADTIESGARHFLSFDTKSAQRILAHTQNLKVWPALTYQEDKRLKQSGRHA